MSLKIRFQVDTIQKPIEGYVSNDFGYAIMNLLEEGIENYKNRRVTNPSNEKKQED